MANKETILDTRTYLCTVVAVSSDQGEVTMENSNGNRFVFFTDGCTDCTVGSQWEVTFDRNMEIVSVE